MLVNTATYLWIEAGDMSGGSRNQIEFSDDLAKFFDDQARSSAKVFIAYDKETKAFCPFTNRAQDYGQWANIWRLGLITKAKGGVDYQGRVIFLERRKIGKSYVYVIFVDEVNSEKHKEWKAKSVVKGITSGAEGRAYGYF
ncbi:hypothetical protein [Massilia sp. CT11-137]|uniref:hypothetical protein n=1 Tax=Massilia sp. CT11-137 TaxID=3393901 RepID=UPI0039A6DFF4